MNTIIISSGANGGFLVKCNDYETITDTLKYRTGVSLELYDSLNKTIAIGDPQDFTVVIDGVDNTGFTTFSEVRDAIEELSNSTNIIGSVTVTGVATAVKQSDGTQKTQIVDQNGDQFNAGVCNASILANISDTVDLLHPGYIQPRLLGGTVVVTDMDNNDSTLELDLKECTLFIVKRVKSTGTTPNMGIRVYYKV